MRIDRQQYEREFQATLLSCSSHNLSLELCCMQRHSSPEGSFAYSSFSGNCVGDAASSGCGFVLTNYVIPVREAICAMHMPSLV